MTGPEAKEGRPFYRRIAFWGGVAAGAAAPVGALYALMILTNNGPGPTVTIAAEGAEMTRSGVARVRIVHDGGALTQTCKGTCDDLEFRAWSDKEGYAVQVLDAEGRCLSCGPRRFVAYDPMGLSARWRIGGADGLKVTVEERIGGGPARTVSDPVSLD